MDAQSEFGVALKQLRQARGLTQEQLAERAGLTRNAIAALERGRRQQPYPHTLRALADALALSEAERDQLVALARRPESPPPAPVAAPTRALPAALTPLIGRASDAAAVQALLEGNATRLATLTGAGGVGKTRLALHVAARMGGVAPDGATFVALASLEDHALIIPRIAQALGLRDVGDHTIAEVLHAHLRDQRALLVLDNLEHLLDGTPAIAALLAACPALRILATSRTPLRLRGEQEYAVEPLAVPDPARAPTVAAVRGAPAAALFVARAQAVNAAFVLSEHNAAAVAALCWRLDGLPLALELAAAQIRYLGPTELLARLDQVLRASGARDLPERQRTMRATLDWSYTLLSDVERVLFRRLAVFVGGFTLAAAEAVAAGGAVAPGDVVGLLGGLVEQSLVTARTADDGSTYGLLEPIRQYALDHLAASGEAVQVRARHAAFYHDLAMRAGAEVQRADQAAWLERLQREYSNLQATLSWTLEQGKAEQVAEIGWAIWRLWSFRGQASEGLYWMGRVLDATDALTPAARAMALTVVGVLELSRGNNAQTAALLDTGVVAAQAAGDAAMYAAVRTLQGLAAVGNNDADRAELILTEAVALCREQENATFIVYGLTGLSQVALTRGDIEAASQFNAEGEAISRRAGDWIMLTALLILEALVDRMTGSYERAARRLRESIELAALLDDTWSMVLGATTLAGVAVADGQGERAARLFAAVEATSAATGLEVSWPLWRAQRDRDIAALRDQFGPQRFAACWAEGRALALEQAISDALASVPPPSSGAT